MASPGWLQASDEITKTPDMRHLVFEDPSVLKRLEYTVGAAAAAAPPSPPSPTTTSTTPVRSDEAPRTSFSDPDFESPRAQCSPEAASVLLQAFSVLRNACAGCRPNQDTLRRTSLVDTALKFAVEQAQFACEGSRPSATGIGPAVQAALQFSCNYCVGNEENQAQVWKAWFPRGFMELMNGLKTDRRLLSLAVALIYNCCLSLGGSRGLEKEGDGTGAGACAEWKGGQERLRRLTADKAFCCLLMKVVVPRHRPQECSAGFSEQDGHNSSGTRGEDEDPAAEWLYLMFCRFIKEGLSRSVYDNVGIAALRRPSTDPSSHLYRRRSDSHEGGDGLSGAGVEEEGDAKGSSAGTTAVDGAGGRKLASRDAAGEWVPQLEIGEGGEDSSFPVTPEQLVVLNMTEVAAGDEVLTGGDSPRSSEQRQACNHLVSWLSGLLAEMPLDQSLRPDDPHPLPPNPEVSHAAAASGEAELARRRMREEAGSAVLRALAVLLASCNNETRHTAVAGESRLLPLCLSLLSACGGAAEPEAKLNTGDARTSAARRAPVGRKAELLKVIGNACFRCSKAQDSVREADGLPLVLNHCTIDGANPLLREYALLAVRNLCEGNPTNQALITSLQPQECAPGVEGALAAMGLEGRVDGEGKLRVEPRASP